jgi:protein tyrosine phosphatase (PTP) superfamily phosphohydrolase (DUF442 family)
MRYVLVAAVVLAGTAATWLTIETRRNRLVWDHFDVVKHGILYRSGQLNGDQLTDAVGRFRIKTIVNFQIDGPGVEFERRLARNLGVDFMNLPMPGDGFGEEAQFREVLKACDDPNRRPVLIHCARGTCRTGAAVALYRYERDGWTVDDVAREMKRQSYSDGWLPGYVLAMSKNKPVRDIFEPKIGLDKNQPEPPPAPARKEVEVDGLPVLEAHGKGATHVR